MATNKNQYAVILAGGSGTRFWPISRQKKPKQFLNVTGEGTLFEETIKRIKSKIPVKQIISVEELAQMQKAAEGVAVDDRIYHYIVDLVQATRSRDRDRHAFARFIDYGASPRASLYILRCAKVRALFAGRNYLIPDDVKAIAPEVLRHRLVLSYEAESEELGPDQIIGSVLSSVSVP